MNPSALLNNSKPFIILSVLFMVGIILFSTITLNSNGSSVYNISSVEVTITNNSGKEIEHLCISSNYEQSVGEFDSLASGDTIKNVFNLPYLGEGSALLCFMDDDGIAHEELIIGYLMPSNEVHVIVHQADTFGFVVSVKEDI